MTNKEKYKQAFSALQTSGKISLEVQKMTILAKKRRRHAVAAAAAACIILVGGTGTAYAANVGGIQRTVQLWIHGDQTSAEITANPDGSYNISYPDENGNTVERGAGGIAMDSDGTQRPLTEEEILEELNSPEVIYEDDGSVWVYYYDQKLDITEKFDEDGICYVKLNNGKETMYLTIKYNDGYAMSSDKYVEPSAFNCEPSE